MRILLLAAALSLNLVQAAAQSEPPPFPPPAHPATVAQIQQIMTLSHSDEGIRRQLQAGIADQERNGPKFLPASFWADFKLQIEKTDWLAFFTPIYQRFYSTDDATELIHFYSTPAGQKLIAASQPLLREAIQKSTQLGREIGEQMGKKHAAEINALIKQSNPESPLTPLLSAPPPPPPPPPSTTKQP